MPSDLNVLAADVTTPPTAFQKLLTQGSTVTNTAPVSGPSPFDSLIPTPVEQAAGEVDLGTGLGRGIVRGGLKFVRGLGGILRMVGLEGIGKSWSDWADESMKDYMPSASVQNSAFAWDNWRWWTENASEQLVNIASSLGLAWLTGGYSAGAQLAAFAAPTFVQEAGNTFNNAFEARTKRGEDEGTAYRGALAEGGLTGLTSALLEVIPFSALINRTPVAKNAFSKYVGSNVHKWIERFGIEAFLAEGLTEAAQEATADMFQWGIRNDPDAFKDWQNRYLGAGVLGGTMGGGMQIVHSNLTHSYTPMEQIVQEYKTPEQNINIFLEENGYKKEGDVFRLQGSGGNFSADTSNASDIVAHHEWFVGERRKAKPNEITVGDDIYHQIEQMFDVADVGADSTSPDEIQAYAEHRAQGIGLTQRDRVKAGYRAKYERAYLNTQSSPQWKLYFVNESNPDAPPVMRYPRSIEKAAEHFAEMTDAGLVLQRVEDNRETFKSKLQEKYPDISEQELNDIINVEYRNLTVDELRNYVNTGPETDAAVQQMETSAKKLRSDYQRARYYGQVFDALNSAENILSLEQQNIQDGKTADAFATQAEVTLQQLTQPQENIQEISQRKIIGAYRALHPQLAEALNKAPTPQLRHRYTLEQYAAGQLAGMLQVQAVSDPEIHTLDDTGLANVIRQQVPHAPDNIVETAIRVFHEGPVSFSKLVSDYIIVPDASAIPAFAPETTDRNIRSFGAVLTGKKLRDYWSKPLLDVVGEQANTGKIEPTKEDLDSYRKKADDLAKAAYEGKDVPERVITEKADELFEQMKRSHWASQNKGQLLAVLSRISSDKARGFAGQVSKLLNSYLEEAGGTNIHKRREVNDLAQPVRVLEPTPVIDPAGRTTNQSVEAFNSKLSLAVEGILSAYPISQWEFVDLGSLTPFQSKLIRQFRELVKATGKQAEAVGVQTEVKNPDTGKWELKRFIASPDGKRFPRRYTDLFYEIMSDKTAMSPLRDAIITAIAKLNPPEKADMSFEEHVANVREAFERRFNTRTLNVFNSETGNVERVLPLEQERYWKNFPSSIKVNGRVYELVHSGPIDAATNMVYKSSLRLGYYDVFINSNTGLEEVGIELPPGHTPEDFVLDFARAGGNVQDLVDLLRTLNGIPLEQTRWMPKPDTAGYKVFKLYDMFTGIIKAALLSRSAIPNFFEPLSKTQAMTGVTDWLRSWYELAKKFGNGAMAQEAMQQGGYTKAVLDMTTRPSQPGDRVGAFADNVRKMSYNLGIHINPLGGLKINEINEAHAAVAGLLMSKRIKSGAGTALDKIRLDILGFSTKEVQQIMLGEAELKKTMENSRLEPSDVQQRVNKIYDRVATRMAEFTQGSTSFGAERSRAANSNIYRRVVAFDSWAQMSFNRFSRVLKAWGKAIKSGSLKDKTAASIIMLRYMGGAFVSGASVLMTRALMFGGLAGLAVAWRSMDDDTPEDQEARKDFVIGSFLQGTMGGPFEVAKRAVGDTSNSEGFAAALARYSLPASITMEVYDAINGSGKYRDKDWLERVGTMAKGYLSLSPLVATTASSIALNEEPYELNRAIKWYWAFYKDLKGPFPAAGNPEEEYMEFRYSARKLYEAIRSGDMEAANRWIRSTFGAKLPTDKQGLPELNEEKIAGYLAGKQLLSRLSISERMRLKDRIGEEGYEKLVHHDAVLKGWAQSFHNLNTPAEKAVKALSRDIKQEMKPSKATSPKTNNSLAIEGKQLWQ